MTCLSLLLVVAWFSSVTLSQTTPSPTQTDPTCATTRRVEGTDGDRRTDKYRLRIATYNVEFLYHWNYSCTGHSLKCPGSSCDWKTTEDADSHMQQVADAIMAIDADIIAMPETEDCCVLDYFMTFLPTNHNYSNYLYRGTDYATGQNVALLTRIEPWIDVTKTIDRGTWPRVESTCSGTWNATDKAISKNIIVEFDNVDNFPNFTLMGVHLLAWPTDSGRCGEREGQSEVVVRTVRSHMAEDRAFVVLGDLNDFDNDWPDIQGNAPITNVLKYIKQSGNLTNTAQYVNVSQRYTHYTQSAYDGDCAFSDSYLDQYDYVLTSPQLTDMISNVSIHTQMCGGYYPDHLPLVVTMRATEESNPTSTEVMETEVTSTESTQETTPETSSDNSVTFVNPKLNLLFIVFSFWALLLL